LTTRTERLLSAPGEAPPLPSGGPRSTLDNGELLAEVEDPGFEVLVTTDLNLKYQQNLAHRRIAIVVLSTPSWPRIQGALDSVVAAVEQAPSSSYIEVDIP
jgi:hypothetical protein